VGTVDFQLRTRVVVDALVIINVARHHVVVVRYRDVSGSDDHAVLACVDIPRECNGRRRIGERHLQITD